LLTIFSYFRLWADRPESTGLVIAFALLLASVALCRYWQPWRAHLRARPVMTANEAEFFYRLSRALPACHVFPQVSFSALVSVDERLSARQRFDVRRRFGWKCADFVICQRGTLTVLAVIELDDRTHRASADRKRDATLAAAGYRTLRFLSTRKPSEAEIAALFPR